MSNILQYTFFYIKMHDSYPVHNQKLISVVSDFLNIVNTQVICVIYSIFVCIIYFIFFSLHIVYIK